MDAARLGLIRDLDTRPSAVPGAATGKTAATFLIHATNTSPAQDHTDVTVARAMDPETGPLPRTAAAFAAGEISRAHTDVAVRCLHKIPKHLADAVDADGSTGRQKVDAFLADHSRTLPPKATEHLARHLLSVLDPTGTDRYDPQAHLRRRVTRTIDSTGMGIGHWQLDPTATATFYAVLDTFAAPHPATTAIDEHGHPALIPDQRTKPQRDADALYAMALAAARAGGTGGRSIPVQINLIATPEQIAAARQAARTTTGPVGGHPTTAPSHQPTTEPKPPPGPPSPPDPPNDTAEADTPLPDPAPTDTPLPDPAPTDITEPDPAPTDITEPDPAPTDITEPDPAPPPAGLANNTRSGPITPATLARFTCDAGLQRVLLAPNGAALNLGRTTRLVTPGQRAALIARDRGCVIPHCPAPPEHCDAHHLRPWALGGLSDLNNYVLACPTDHTALHGGIWTIVMIDAVPWAIPPPWIDPQRRPVRNTTHHNGHQAHFLGQQLRLPLDQTTA
jgi:outer membrane biosynthesis protein TonB